MKRHHADLVPCFCQLCNGNLVMRYFRRKHAQTYCDTNKQIKISNIEESVHLQPSAKDTTESGISVNRAVDDEQSIVEDLSQDPPTEAVDISVVV